MKTIATAAGVTQATVSMSLANHPRIPLATRVRIQGLAKKLGYQPNPYVSTLMRVRRQGRPLRDKPVLALVCAQRTADGWRNHPAQTIRQMREGAMERAITHGYRPQEFWLYRDGMSRDRFSAMLHVRGIRGLLISPLGDGDATPALHWENFCAVSISVPRPESTITTVCNDHYFSSLQAARECHRRGYQRIGLLLLRSHQMRFQGRWQAGVLVAPHLLPGLKLVPPLLVEEMTDEAGILRWLRREKPDAIISPGCDSLYEMLPRRGWRVPQDVGLAWLSCTHLGHPCSGIFQNGRLIGAMAVDTLVSQLERHESGLPEQARTLMIEGQWNEGQSLRPPAF